MSSGFCSNTQSRAWPLRSETSEKLLIWRISPSRMLREKVSVTRSLSMSALVKSSSEVTEHLTNVAFCASHGWRSTTVKFAPAA